MHSAPEQLFYSFNAGKIAKCSAFKSAAQSFLCSLPDS